MKSHRKGLLISLLFIAVTLISILGYTDNPIPLGPYKFEYPANFGNRINIPPDNPTTQQGVYLGRMLFYETKLSAHNALSCASCHKQELAFTDGKAFSRGVDFKLTSRNSMSLVNLLWARKFFWDGRATGLEAQAVIPMSNPHEMGQDTAISAKKLNSDKQYHALFKLVYGDENITGDRIIKAIAQFERTLISANSKYDQYLANKYQPTTDELKGMELFNRSPQADKGIRGANCTHCHGGAKNYMELFHNNGLDSIPKDKGIETLTGVATDRARFKVPTLRNIALTAPYMHDGRFKTLNQVLDHYSDHVLQSPALSSVFRGESNEIGGKQLKLDPEEKKQIIAFLNMLTDSTFVTDPRFSDPRLSKNKTKL
ncbi:cytochrome-c peroxidase [Mucilaginibacter rivuli]|uniref:cytochrome-c peroxidase n=1 Tax=Mucilaginibacter rivuli TaxID=2857527 RepID=UPI002107DFAC|nr:cytochrome c peroxidase [Mucilaginibacter rivuli]